MIRGISIHSDILKMIISGLRYGQVHSVFNKTINIIDENNNMISLLTKTLDKAPYSILVDALDLKKSGVSLGDKVFFTKEKVLIGSEILDLSGAINYELKRGTFNGCYPLIEKNLEVIRYLMDSKGTKGEYIFDIEAYQMITKKTNLLKEAYLKGEYSQVVNIARSLIGLGPGLTPSGDDVIMGLFLTLGLENSPVGNLDALLGEIIEDKMDETTDISYQGLLRASRGLYRNLLVEAAEAITRFDDVVEILLKVLAIGHTSGQDILYGILTGFEIIIGKENENAN